MTPIIAFVILFSAPLILGVIAILGLWNRGVDREEDYSGADDYLVASAREVTPAAYPREQEPRGS